MRELFTLTEIGHRYAKASFSVAKDHGAGEAVSQDLAALKSMILDSADLRRLITLVTYSTEDRSRAILALAQKAKLHKLTTNLLSLLIKNGRLSSLGSVIAAYQALDAADKGIVSADITSAIALSDEQLEALKVSLSAALNGGASDSTPSKLTKTIVVNTHIDPNLLGGLKVRLGSRLFDASLKTKLQSLQFALKRA